MAKTPLIQNRQNLITLSVTFAAIIILVFYSFKRFHDYREYQQQLAQLATSNITEKISKFILERERLVGLFANQNIDLIENLLQDTRSEHAQRQMKRNLRVFFPNYFTYTLSSPTGIPYFEDYEGLVMDSCRKDLTRFALEQHYLTYIHPHPDGYHFDIMARYNDDKNDGILFISFQAEFLGEMLRSVEPDGQQLMLVYPEKNDLIEVVTTGTRSSLPRDDFRMTAEEKSRVLVRNNIDHTRWQAVILVNPDLFSDYKIAILVETATIILVVLLFAGWIIYKNTLRQKVTIQAVTAEALDVEPNKTRMHI